MTVLMYNIKQTSKVNDSYSRKRRSSQLPGGIHNTPDYARVTSDFKSAAFHGSHCVQQRWFHGTEAAMQRGDTIKPTSFCSSENKTNPTQTTLPIHLTLLHERASAKQVAVLPLVPMGLHVPSLLSAACTRSDPTWCPAHTAPLARLWGMACASRMLGGPAPGPAPH